MKSIGMKAHKMVRSESGSIYILLSVFLIALLLFFAFILFLSRLMILSGDIENAFKRNGAGLITKIRVDYYSSVAETNPDTIDLDLNSEQNAEYRETLLRSFIHDFSDSLECDVLYDRPPILEKRDSDGIPLYEIGPISMIYGESICTLRAVLTIPIRFNSRDFYDYTKELEYNFAFKYK